MVWLSKNCRYHFCDNHTVESAESNVSNSNATQKTVTAVIALFVSEFCSHKLSFFNTIQKSCERKKNRLFHTVRRSITKSNLSWKFRCKFIEMCLIQLSGFCSVVLKDLFQPLYCIDWMEDIQLDHPIVSAAGYPPNFNWIYARGVTKTYKTKCWPLSESNFSFFLLFFFFLIFTVFSMEVLYPEHSQLAFNCVVFACSL